MPRALKAFSQADPVSPQTAAPTSNRFSLDLSGLNLSEDQLAQVRHSAVKSAMAAAANLLARGSRAPLDDFGTFSTFSTFGSGAAAIGPGESRPSQEAQEVINKVVRSSP
jgi:hypothetical protein